MNLTLLRCAVCLQLLADLDDGMTGYKIYDNTFIDVMQGVMLNGGRDNLIHNNYFQVCDRLTRGDRQLLSSCLLLFVSEIG
jgi:hypothetical protein